MKNELKGDIKRYQRRIRSNLLCSTKLSKQFMTDLACAIDSFIEENGEPGLDNILDDEEYELASDAFDEWLDSHEFDDLVYEDGEEVTE